MPDFDIDFDERRRGEVIRYVTEKYGDDRVAQIVTYGTIKAKQAVKDASRVLGYPFGVGEKITKAMPAPVMGKDVSLAKIFDPEDKRYGEGAEFRALYEADPDVKTVVDTAKDLEGLKRQWGVHAAGVIMSSEPLIDIIPIMRREQDGAIITQFDYPTCEALGPDQDGLPRAAQPHRARRRAGQHRAEPRLRPGAGGSGPGRPGRRTRCSAAATRWGSSSSTAAPMRQLLRSMRPDNFADISAVLALYRPGPMGADTPQQVRPAQDRPGGGQRDPPGAGRAAGGDPGRDLRVDRLPGTGAADRPEGRRLLARQGRPAAQGHGQEEEGGAGRGVRAFSAGMRDERLQRLGDQARSGTSWSRSPTTRSTGPTPPSYGMVSYWTAYLKANYPAEFMAALLTSVADDKDKIAIYLERVPPDGHLGAAARRQRVGGQLHSGRHRHPLRPDRGAQRRAQRGRRHRGGPRARRQGGQLPRFPRPGAAGGLQQAGDRVADQGRGVRLDGTHPPRA